MSLIDELKRRRVFRVTAAYGLVAWLIVQITEVAAEPLGAPDWFLRSVIIVALIGFPVALLLAWVYDLTPQGIVKTSEADAKGVVPKKSPSRAIDFTVIGILLVVIFYQWYSGSTVNETDPERSIAVLPFVDMSPDRDSEYFGDGIAEELLNVLAKISDLRVAARTSSFAFKDKNEDVRIIGEKLNVNTVLEGSIRKAGNRVRVTAQLINVQDGYHLWTETYDRELTDVFEIQDKIAQEIVKSLKLELSVQDVVAEAQKDRTSNYDAYDAYKLGVFGLRKRTEEGLTEAIRYFSRALEADDEYKKAYTGLAQANLLLVSYGNYLVADAVPAAQQAINRALALDPEFADAYAAQGLLYRVTQSVPQADAALEKAITLDPKHAMAQMWYASNLDDQRRYEESIQAYERAYRLEPDSIPLNVNMAQNYLKRGNYERAIEHYERLLAIDSRQYTVGYRRQLGNAYRLQGDLAKAISTWREQVELDPYDTVTMGNLVRAYTDLEDYETAGMWSAVARELDPEQFFLVNIEADLLTAQRKFQAGLELVTVNFQKEVELAKRLGVNEPNVFFLVSQAKAEGMAENADATHDLFVRALSSYQGADGRYNLTDQTLEWAPYAAYSFRWQGDTETADELIQQVARRLEARRVQGFVKAEDYVMSAITYAVMGDSERALTDLEAADEAGWRRYWWWELDPVFETLRATPRYQALIQAGRAKLQQARASVEALAFKPFVPPVRPAAVDVSAEVLAEYVGRYQGQGFALDITEASGRLRAQRPGQQRFDLVPISAREFYFDGVAIDLKFSKNAGGEVTHLDLHQGGVLTRMKLLDDIPQFETIEVDPQIYQAFVGRFKAVDDTQTFIDIYTEEDRLFGRVTGQGAIELLPISNTRYVSKAFEGIITFVIDADETVDLITVDVNEVTIEAERVE